MSVCKGCGEESTNDECRVCKSRAVYGKMFADEDPSKKIRDDSHSLFGTFAPTVRLAYLKMMRGTFPDEIVNDLQTVHDAMTKHEDAEKKTALPLEESDFLRIMERGYAKFRTRAPHSEEELDRLADYIFAGFMSPKNPSALRFQFLKLIAHNQFSAELTKRINHLLFKTATAEALELIREFVQERKGFDA